MPNRILHERICVSETVAELSAEEERFFYRLIVQCDDYGRFDGRASVIRARCFALQLNRVSDDDVSGWLARLEEVGLVVSYVVEERAFLRVTTWERYQQTRAKRSKYPAPDGVSQAPDSTRNHTPAYVPENRESRSETTRSEERETLRVSPPLAPPSEGEPPPTPRKRGARKSRGGRRNGAVHDESSASPLEEPELAPVTPGDVATWEIARAAASAGLSNGNAEALGLLEPIGRAPDGGLHLRAPPGLGLGKFANHVARALLDAGDRAASRVAIVEGRPGERKG